MREYGFKSEYVKKLRAITDSIPLQLPLPRVNPSLVSALSIVTSLAFILVLKYSPVVAWSLVVITLLLDWLDGLIAKKYELCSREGYLVDLIADRISEAILFIPYLVPWFCLFILNSILTLFGIAKRKQIILPLRAAFIVAFVFLELV
jgi:phosphatidylglycerophosphate synthase